MIDVRRAQPADLDAVVALEARIFGSASWSPRSVEEEFEQIGQSRSIVVATAGGTVVGYAVLMYAGASGDVLRIAVSEDRRRVGIASTLLTALVGQAADLGCDQVVLEVTADNEAAVKLYAGEGFERIDHRPRYYPDGRDAVVMRRAIEGRP